MLTYMQLSWNVSDDSLLSWHNISYIFFIIIIYWYANHFTMSPNDSAFVTLLPY